ncbi:MAG: MoxR-like ATPase, partial [Rubritalea sp.]
MDQQSTQIDIASINEKVAQESQFVEVLVNE